MPTFAEIAAAARKKSDGQNGANNNQVNTERAVPVGVSSGTTSASIGLGAAMARALAAKQAVSISGSNGPSRTADKHSGPEIVSTGIRAEDTSSSEQIPQITGVGNTEIQTETEVIEVFADEGEEEAVVGAEITAAEFTHPSQPDIMDAAVVKEMRDALEVLQTALLQDVADTQTIRMSVTYIIDSLQKDPKLKNHLHPEDIGLMVRSIRETYGMAIVTKTTRRGKRQVALAEATVGINMAKEAVANAGIDLSNFKL